MKESLLTLAVFAFITVAFILGVSLMGVAFKSSYDKAHPAKVCKCQEFQP